MTRKIDADGDVKPATIGDVSKQENSSRPPRDWPGIEGRSGEDEAEFVHQGRDEEPAEVTEAQRKLERK